MFAPDGSIAIPDTRAFLHGWVDAYAVWVKKLTNV
jgi:hypothetical protein